MKVFKIIFFSLSILLLIAYSSCNKLNNNCNFVGNYEFVMPFTLSPAKEVYHIGDTITISSFVDNPIYDRKTDKEYYLKNFKFHLVSYLYYLDTNLNGYSDFNRFSLLVDSSFTLEVFNYSDGHNSILGQYNYKDNRYNFEFKLIAKEKGGYFFTQGSHINYYDADTHFEGKCNNKDNDAVFYMNDRMLNNAFLLLEAEDESYINVYNNKLDEKYLDLGGYCFKVVE